MNSNLQRQHNIKSRMNVIRVNPIYANGLKQQEKRFSIQPNNSKVVYDVYLQT